MDESCFQSLTAASTDHDVVIEPGLWALMLSLTDVFVCIQEMNQNLVQGKMSHGLYVSVLASLAERLTVWEEQLPPAAILTEENLDFHCQRGSGGTFVALHLGYHHYSTLLYYDSLEAQRHPDISEVDKMYAERCKSHASSFARLLETSKNGDRCRIMHITTGHMTVISSSVMLHTLLFGEESEAAVAKANMVSNFNTLLELQRHWPSLSKSVSFLFPSSESQRGTVDEESSCLIVAILRRTLIRIAFLQIERLFIFQEACLWSTDMNAYKIDRWMLRFLLEYSLPLKTRIRTNDIVRSSDVTHEDNVAQAYQHSIAAKSLLIDTELQRFKSWPLF